MHETKVAVIGCGQVANGHLRAWNKTSARVIAVSDLNRTLAKSTAQAWHIPHVVNSLPELVSLGNIDVVDICTPPQTHAGLSIEAMEAGFNVLVEKPMTMTVKDAEEIVGNQKRTGLKVGVIHNWLFEPPIIKAKALVKGGALGEVLSMEVEALCTEYDSMAANKQHWCHTFPGGRFGEMLAHPIYLMRHFLGDVAVKNAEVSKTGSYPWMKSDELYATFRYANKIGHAYASFNSSRDAIFINLYGEEAIMRLDIINATLTLLPKRKANRYSKGFDSFIEAMQLVRSTLGNMSVIVQGKWLSGVETYIKLFTENLSQNSEPPVSAQDGLETIKILEKTCRLVDDAETRARE